MKHAVDASGRVLRDNVWGPQEEDAARRDFTVNAMYYDPASQVVVDYHNGIKDAKKLTLRMIGDPVTRYREDPVRIIRAIRFSAKLARWASSWSPRPRRRWSNRAGCWPTCRKAGCSTRCSSCCRPGTRSPPWRSCASSASRPGIYPLLDVVVERAEQPFVKAALQDTDRRVGEGKPVAPSFLLACVLWADVRDGWAQRLEGRHGQRPQAPFPALQDAIDDVFNARIGDVSGRGKLAADMREIWMMQPRFDKRSGSHAATAWSSRRASAPPSTSCACAPTSAKSARRSPSGGRSSAPPTTCAART